MTKIISMHAGKENYSEEYRFQCEVNYVAEKYNSVARLEEFLKGVTLKRDADAASKLKKGVELLWDRWKEQRAAQRRLGVVNG
jgi:hypothetical protein